MIMQDATVKGSWIKHIWELTTLFFQLFWKYNFI